MGLAFVFCAAGLWLAVYGAALVWAGVRARAWPSVVGEVARHRAEYHGASDSGLEYAAVTAYRYRVAGRPYVGERLRFGAALLATTESAALEGARAEHPVGQAVTVYYDPRDPAVSVLEPGPAVSAVLLCGAGCALLALGAVGLLRAAG